MSHEVMITRGQSFFLQINRARCFRRLVLAGWDAEASSSMDLQKKEKCFVLWLSGPHGTSNFDQQTLIRSTLNYSNVYYQFGIKQNL